MQSRKYILKYLQQGRTGNFIFRCGVGVLLALVFATLVLSVGIPGVYANATVTPCSKNDPRHVMVEGDTLTLLASLVHLNVVDLVSDLATGNPSLSLSNQVVCIPVKGFTVGTQVKQINTVPQGKTAVTINLPQRAQVKVIVTPTAVPTTPITVTPTPTTVVSVPTPTPVSSGGGGGGGSITAIIQEVFGSYSAGAINVARCESGLNPNAYNPSGASGLFQIMPGTWAGTSQAGNSPFNAYDNAVAAHEIFVRDGYSWREWTCQP